MRLLTIQAPNERLASGLTLVDTPGVGALNSEHTTVTYSFLPNADAVIFVGDATAPLTETELDFVRRISEHCAVILFVITKIDVRNDYEQVVANTRAKPGHQPHRRSRLKHRRHDRRAPRWTAGPDHRPPRRSDRRPNHRAALA